MLPEGTWPIFTLLHKESRHVLPMPSPPLFASKGVVMHEMQMCVQRFLIELCLAGSLS